MTTRYANIYGVSQGDSLGSTLVRTAIVTFDLANVAFVGGTDTVQFGGGGWVGGVANTLTLAQIIAANLENGGAVTVFDVMRGPPGSQSTATNGPTIYFQGTLAVSAGNVTGLTLFSAMTGGSSVSPTAAYWDRAGAIYVNYTTTGT
jgi:hypothetical protein